LPKRDKTPNEKAISVAEGIAQPLIVSGFSYFEPNAISVCYLVCKSLSKV